MKPGRPRRLRRPSGISRGKLAHYKVPRYVHFVDAFPKTVTGKVRKVETRAETVKLLGLDPSEG